MAFLYDFHYLPALRLLLASIGAVLTLTVVTLVTIALYNIYLHPLRAFPGPKLWAATRLPWNRENLAGRLAFVLRGLHNKYGRVVRIGPDELSYLPEDTQTWSTIYAHRPKEMPKDLTGHGLPPPAGAHGIITADEENHARIRKLASPALSDRALRDQEKFLAPYIAKFLDTVRRDQNQKQNIAKLFNWTTFDFIGDLTFGESFGGLDGSSTHPWVNMIIGHVKAIAVVQFNIYYGLTGIMSRMLSKQAIEARRMSFQVAADKVGARLRRKEEGRKDFISYMEQIDPGSALSVSKDELMTTSYNFIAAGAETSGTLLSGLVYFLTRNRLVYSRLVQEIRSSFASPENIDMTSVARLEYLTAVIQETMRIYPASLATLPRVVPKTGAKIGDAWVPGNTVVGINHFSTYRSAQNFSRPDDFVPERWLDEHSRPSEFNGDHREAFQPFSFGPRSCLGRSLANVEVRLIICHLLWHFDLELCQESKNWTQGQKVYLVWEKPPLFVRATERVRQT